MRKIVLTNLLLTSLMLSLAQAPLSFNYQAVLRDGSGNVKANVTATIQISILQGSETGTILYTETHQISTNNLGLVNLQIGSGTIVSGNFAAIDWSKGLYYIKISCILNFLLINL